MEQKEIKFSANFNEVMNAFMFIIFSIMTYGVDNNSIFAGLTLTISNLIKDKDERRIFYHNIKQYSKAINWNVDDKTEQAMTRYILDNSKSMNIELFEKLSKYSQRVDVADTITLIKGNRTVKKLSVDEIKEIDWHEFLDDFNA